MDIEQFDSQIKNLERGLYDSIALNDKLRKQTYDQKHKIEQLETENKRLTTDNKTLSEQLEACYERIEIQDAALSQRDYERERLGRETVSLLAHWRDCSRKLTDAQNVNKAIMGDYAEQGELLAAHKGALEDCAKMHEEMKRELHDALWELNSVRSERDYAQNELNITRVAFETEHHLAEQIVEENTRLKEKFEHAQQTNNEMLSRYLEVDALRVQLVREKEASADITKRYLDIDTRCGKLVVEIQDLKSKIADLENEVAELEALVNARF